MDPQAPPVVAVVAACDAGPWFEEGLAALGAQDYPNLSVLVIYPASTVDPTPRVGAVLPGAFVRRVDRNDGYAATTNHVLDIVEGASHYLLCHDDVAPDPDAVRLLVEEAFRSNAGIVSPKLVDWDAPERLLQVGMTADKSGAPAALIDDGELDQQQYDSVRDIFVAPGGCTLVRADLFAALGGMDGGMAHYGEDLDMSWRAHVAGARVVVAPAARVRHVEAAARGLRPVVAADAVGVTGEELLRRHQLRAALKGYGRWHLLRVVPQVVLLSAAELVVALLAGRWATGRAIVGAWAWNLAHLGAVGAERRQVRRHRAVPDAEVRRLQARGSARLTAFVRDRLGPDRARTGRRPEPRTEAAGAAAEVGGSTGEPAPAGPRPRVAAWGAVALVLLAGSRQLLGSRLPALGQLAPLPSPSTLFGLFTGGWRTTGLGAEAPAPLAFALLGVAGTAFGGAMGLLQQVLVLGPIPLGAAGMYRLTRPLGGRARLVAVVVYLSIPLPYNALARGHWGGLVLYACAPWTLGRLLRATRTRPFDQDPARPLAYQVLGLGVLVTLAAAFAPLAVAVPLLVAGGLLAGAALAGRPRPALRAVVVAGGAAAVAAALCFPWTLDFVLPGARLSGLAGVQGPLHAALGLGALLRFQTGPVGAGPLGWAPLLVAALPLLVGRAWRLSRAVELWGVALVCWGLVWGAGRGWLPPVAGVPEVLLAPAAAALALSAALGLVAFDVDLPGYRFGWRQAVSMVAAGAAALAVLPVLQAAAGGRWRAPAHDQAEVLAWMHDKGRDGGFRVLWLGDGRALPLAGWSLGDGIGGRAADGMAYATSQGGPPDATEQWPHAAPGPTSLLAEAVGVAVEGRTTRLGHLLAPMAVRYVVVPLRAAPLRQRTPLLAPPPALVEALRNQVDLRRVDSDGALILYENVAWAPALAALDPESAAASAQSGLVAAQGAELSRATPVLGVRSGPTDFSGPVPAGAIELAEAASDRWSMRVDGRQARRRPAFGWANTFTVAEAGRATLSYRTSPTRRGALTLEALLWAVALRWLFALWRGGRTAASRTTRLPALRPAPGAPVGAGVASPLTGR
jgi:GT2 family glycosyltransferase